jgi:hypothetical protein
LRCWTMTTLWGKLGREGAWQRKWGGSEEFRGWKKKHSAALNHLDCLLDYLESEECCLLGDKLIWHRLGFVKLFEKRRA